MRILVVEDEAKVASFIRQALEEESYAELDSLLDIAETIVLGALPVRFPDTG